MTTTTDAVEALAFALAPGCTNISDEGAKALLARLAKAGFTIARAEPAVTDASETDPMLIKVLNFIERCRDLQIISGGSDADNKTAEREDLRTSADAIYKELEAVKWGVRAGPAMSEAELEREAEKLCTATDENWQCPEVKHYMTKEKAIELAKRKANPAMSDVELERRATMLVVGIRTGKYNVSEIVELAKKYRGK